MGANHEVRASTLKEQAVDAFRDHVSSGKVRFFQQFNLDLVIGRREGPWIWDLESEKRLFNLHCNGGVFNLGHRNPEIMEVLRAALEEVDIGNSHLISMAKGDLAKSLAKLMPEDLEYTIFGASGGEAIDVAFKVARAFTGRTKIISAQGGYHGHTGLAMAAGDAKYREPFGPQLPGFVQVPFGDADSLASEVDEDAAAIVLETVPATLGMVVPSKEYLRDVRELCDRSNALFIADEVQTGLGRTGKMWGFEHFDIVPDIVVLGKGLSGGIYPITATVLRKSLESVFHADPFIHVSTFGGADLGCIVAQRVLEISSSPEFLEHVNRLANRFAKGVSALSKKYQILKGLRQLGLFMGLELEDELSGPILCFTGFQHNLFMVYANNDKSVCQFLPPLVTEFEQVDWVLEQLDRALAAAQQFKGSI